ncbi:uncharacterized protein LOC131614084 [Vicia villosa]|uniref:uncharacterized protein LOC131614084 n=1 Tax=Vicia villosa TaxID=3911 RepID=UPI00273B8923|nr:uncharacterized protein LOC131614084 [Vicia villosa]
MAATTQTEEYVELKLLVNEESNKVVFAEAGKDFVDILCSFLTMPLGTIGRLSHRDSNMGSVTIGCLNSLYQSVADLEEVSLLTDSSKELLLQPKNSSEDYCCTLKINIDESQPTNYFITCVNCYCDRCPSLYISTSIDEHYKCRGTKRSVVLKHFCNGFVNCDATFVVTNDLVIMANSMVYTSFSLLKNSGIVTSSTKEVTVNVTKDKVLDLLKCALVSKSPLTDVFLGEKPSIERSRFFTSDDGNISNIQITIQLVIRKSDEKILFAHGEQDFADLLLSFLAYPLGGVVGKLKGCSSIGSIDGLYKSIVELDENKNFMSKEAKHQLVDPHLVLEFKSTTQILPINQSPVSFYCYYEGKCSKQSILDQQFFISNELRRDGGKYVSVKLVKDKENAGSKEGYVKGPTTYLVTDDLVIGPSSPISVLLLINRLQIPLADLKEKVVTIGMKECLSILKAALTSTSALTNALSHLLTEDKEKK